MDVLKYLYGARGRSRTGTVFPPRDFKSLASTNFATRALRRVGYIKSNLFTIVVVFNYRLPQRHPGIEKGGLYKI
jgi:hypothetical protein